MLDNICIEVMRMSIIASVAAVPIIFFRAVFSNKLPKIISYVLWLIVLVRLLIPFSLPSMFSIYNAITFPEKIMTQNSEYSGTNNNVTERQVNQTTAQEKSVSSIIKQNLNSSFSMVTPQASVDPMQIFIIVFSWVWVSGMAGLMICSLFAYARTSHRLKEAVLYKENDLIERCSRMLKLHRKVQIFTSGRIHTPVVCGLLKPRIILPQYLAQGSSELELTHIITHELVHIKRFDYLIKPLAVLTLCLHWFNPVIWLSFVLSQKDMEMSCDAKVLSVSERDIRSEYANSLIAMASRQNVLFNGGLLAFGENNIKSRIKGIMKYKKTRVWSGIAAIAILIIFGFVLLTNGLKSGVDGGINRNSNSPLISMNEKNLNNLLQHRSKYIGDASNVSKLLRKLPYGDRLKGISLETDKRPYGITINYLIEDTDKLQNIKPVLADNALTLFSLIENCETVNFCILSTNGYEFQYTRAEMQKYFSKDLWVYSKDKKSFTEFLMEISFEILVYPAKYTPAMSSVQGIRIDASLNAVYYPFDFSIRYSAKKGLLRPWKSGIFATPNKTISLPNGPVNWSPLSMTDADKEDTVTISILDKYGNVVIEKQISIKYEDHLYQVKPSYDVLTDNFYDSENN